MLEDEKRQATEQAKMLEMDLEVCDEHVIEGFYSHLPDSCKREGTNTTAS